MSDLRPQMGAPGLAAIRHELRAPLNHVIGYVEMLLERRELPRNFSDKLTLIHKAGRRLLRALSGLFDEDVPDPGDARTKICRDLRAPVTQMIEHAESLIEEAGTLGIANVAADLQQILVAARQWLDLMEHYLLPGADGETPLDILSSLPLPEVPDWTPPARAKERGRILVIDDDAQNRDILSRRLLQAGHEVATAEDGQTGLRMLDSGAFDLVLLDRIMPGLSGTDVLKEMRKRPELNEIPAVVLSALDDQDGIVECIELGAEDYIAKPYRPAILYARINSCLEKRRLRLEEQRNLRRIKDEKAKSERLLLNILPAAIAERLKAGEKEPIADLFDDVTVLFADLVDFTAIAAADRPQDVVAMLNEIFSGFDALAEFHGLEKIKTIGDAYMAVAGLPVRRPDHAKAIAECAIAMLDQIEDFNRTARHRIALRVGIDTGPVVAGIIGRRKFTYDLWGDTVNTANRMESHGLPGHIQVTSTTRDRLRDSFRFRKRGDIEIKGKGVMTTWLLEP